MHPRIAAAVKDVGATFADHTLTCTELEDGSMWVTIANVDFGAGWVPRAGDLAVKLAPTFPDTGPYPWYLPAGIHRDDGVTIDRISPVDVDGAARAQLSLNAPWSPGDSLGARAFGVLRWMRVRIQATS